MSARIILLFVFSILYLGACASTSSSPQSKTSSESEVAQSSDQVSSPTNTIPEDERVAPGFEFRLAQLEDKSLNGKFRVNFDGVLERPYDVRIPVRNVKLSDLQSIVSEKYKPFFRNGQAPTLRLSSREYWIEVRGLVGKPGRYLVKQATTLEEVISLAGGFNEKVLWVRVEQNDGQGNVDQRTINLAEFFNTGDVSQLPKWEGGEKVFFLREDAGGQISTTRAVQMLGEVRKPGAIPFRPGLGFYDYLTSAGGPSNYMNPDRVELFRGAPGQTKTKITFSLSEPETVPSIQNGDLIVVHAERIRWWERIISTASQAATVITTLLILRITL